MGLDQLVSMTRSIENLLGLYLGHTSPFKRPLFTRKSSYSVFFNIRKNWIVRPRGRHANKFTFCSKNLLHIFRMDQKVPINSKNILICMVCCEPNRVTSISTRIIMIEDKCHISAIPCHNFNNPFGLVSNYDAHVVNIIEHFQIADD